MLKLFNPVVRTEDCLAGIRDCLHQGSLGKSPVIDVFEKAWVSYSKLPLATYVNSGSSALLVALKVLTYAHNWEVGDEVVTTPFTWIATNYSIKENQLKPVFADIDSSLNLNPESVEKQITAKTKAIMFVGIGGSSLNLNNIIEIARKYGLVAIVDGAHLAGSFSGGIHVGGNADVVTFSFNATKNLSTPDGGMICFKDKYLDSLAKKFRYFGMNATNTEIRSSSYKYSGNSISAMMGIVGLKYLNEDNQKRSFIANEYDKVLSDIAVKHSVNSSKHLYQIVIPNRNLLRNLLFNKGIGSGVHYRCCTDFTPFDKLEKKDNAERLAQKVLSLPLHLGITKEDVSYICSIVKGFL